MPRFSNTWFQNAAPYWRTLFDRLGWRDGRRLTIVEIGSFEGQSTSWMLAELLRHPDSRIHCVDSFAGGIEHGAGEVASLRDRFDANIAETGMADRVRVHQGPSHEGLPALRREGVRADFVYVDGSHQAADVLEDLVLAFRLLRVGGIMICDDYLWFMENMNGRSPGREDLLHSPKIAIDAFVNINIRRLHLVRGQPLYQLAFQKSAE